MVRLHQADRKRGKLTARRQHPRGSTGAEAGQSIAIWHDVSHVFLVEHIARCLRCASTTEHRIGHTRLNCLRSPHSNSHYADRMASKEPEIADAGTQERKGESGNAVDEDRSMTSTAPRNDKKQRQDESAPQRSRTRQEQKSGPPGGFDSTPIPSPPPDTVGYTVKFTL